MANDNDADVDDLDAFFDDVEKVVEEVDEAEEKGNDNQPPPNKKQKTEAQKPPPIRPQGVVVAAASSYKATAKSPAGNESEGNKPLPASQSNSLGSTTSHQVYGRNQSTATATAPVGPQYPQYPQQPQTSNPYGMNHYQGDANPSAAAPKDEETAKKHVRTAGGKTWVDTSLDDWPDNDFRIFVGNLSGEVSDEQLYQHFTRYSSLQRVKIVRDNTKKTNESKGYGFVSFGDALECAKAIREMDQTWLGRPIRIKRSTWKDRELKQVRKKDQKTKKYQKKRGFL